VPKLVGFSHAVYKISLNYGNPLRDCVNSGGVAYMAPEILRKERYDERIDVYAVGVCIWYMVAGELPVSGKEV
jgi:serine/threonine protein kinase